MNKTILAIIIAGAVLSGYVIPTEAAKLITTSMIADNAITTPKIADGNVTNAKLSKVLGSEAVTTATIRNQSVTGAKIAPSTITSFNLANGSVTGEKIAGLSKLLFGKCDIPIGTVIPANGTTTVNCSFSGVSTGDNVSGTINTANSPFLLKAMYVSGTDTISIELYNPSGHAVTTSNVGGIAVWPIREPENPPL